MLFSISSVSKQGCPYPSGLPGMIFPGTTSSYRDGMGEHHPVPPTLPLFPIPAKNCSNAHAHGTLLLENPLSAFFPALGEMLPHKTCSHGKPGCSGMSRLSQLCLGAGGELGGAGMWDPRGKVGRDQAGVLLPYGALIIKQARQAQMAALI